MQDYYFRNRNLLFLPKQFSNFETIYFYINIRDIGIYINYLGKNCMKPLVKQSLSNIVLSKLLYIFES